MSNQIKLPPEIVEKWNEAEEAIKLAEQVNNEVIIPSINELRYAARRLMEAQVNPEKASEYINDATFFCC